ncbi:MAG: hypothetical protein WC477_00740 [Patescibacteria group bacterium]
MMPSSMGNQITNNAIGADDAKELIERAVKEVSSKTGWRLRDEQPLFSGRYYDSKKVGSFVARVTNDEGASAVLKLQLRPLPYDEGMIIRHIQGQIKTSRVRLPNLFSDEPWNEARGYGFLIMEDASTFPRLWASHCPTAEEMKRHEEFLKLFMHDVLPIEPFLPAPDVSVREKYREALNHFSDIAEASSYHHVDPSDIKRMKAVYLEVLDRVEFDGFHFTHGHLSGMEIHEDKSSDAFVLFSNLIWSFRPTYYEVVFPLWVDLMGIRDIDVRMQDMLVRIDEWAEIWQRVTGIDPREHDLFYFLILERSMMTVMLDLGASEWTGDEIEAKQALLNAWEELFAHLAKQFQRKISDCNT